MEMRAGFRTDLSTTIQTSHAKAGRTTPVGNAHLEVWAGIENAPKDERGKHQRVFQRYTDAIGETILLRAREQQIGVRLRMEEQHGAHGLSGFEEGKEVRFIPILRVDHCVQFRPFEA